MTEKKMVLQQLPYDQTYWGKPTAPIDWCELNYVLPTTAAAVAGTTSTDRGFFTSPYYVAEFHNTWTNSSYTIAGLYVLWHAHSFFSSERQLKLKKTKSVFNLLWLSGWSMVLLSIFSGLFHASLLYHYQKLDEIFENLILLFQNYAVEVIISTLSQPRRKGDEPQDSPASLVAAPLNKFLLAGHAFGVSAMIWFVPAIPTAEVHLIGSVLLILWRLNNQNQKFHDVGRSTDDDENKMSTHLNLTVLFFLVGGVGWIIDFLLCPYPAMVTNLFGGDSFNPQLHAYVWHVSTALSLWQGHLTIVEFLKQSNRVIAAKRKKS